MSSRRLSRWFTWGPQWFHGPPLRLVRGADEQGNETLGFVTWAGALFVVTRWSTNVPQSAAPHRAPEPTHA